MQKYGHQEYRRQIAAAIAVIFLLTWQAVAQENLRQAAVKKSHLQPVVLNLASKPRPIEAYRAESTPISAKKRARKNIVVKETPFVNRVFDPYAVSQASIVDTKSAAQQKVSKENPVPVIPSLAVWTGAALVALPGTFLVLFLFLRITSSRDHTKPCIPLESKPVPMMVARKYEQIARKFEEEEENALSEGYDLPALTTAKNISRGHGEVELVMALQGLKMKHPVNQPAGTKVNEKTRLGSRTEAKKLGIGFGEIDLARRLERIGQHKQVAGGQK
jgi:hypothetical protein